MDHSEPKLLRQHGRDHCKICGILLTNDNAYARKDTINGLHAYCKQHYWEQLKQWKENPHRTYKLVVNRGSYEPFVLEFDSMAAKRAYISDRRLFARWGRCHQSESSRNGCAVDRLVEYDEDIHQKQHVQAKCIGKFGDTNVHCDGTLRYDDHGSMVCDKCGTILEGIPFEEAHCSSNYSMVGYKQRRYNLYYNDADDYQTVDKFYTKAMK